MAFLVGELAARLTADDRPLLDKLKGAKKEGSSTAQAVSREFTRIGQAATSQIASIDELTKHIEYLSQQRDKASSTAAIRSYNREIQDLTKKKQDLQQEGVKVEQTTSRMNNAFRVGAALVASYFSVRTLNNIISMATETAALAGEIDTLNKQTGLGAQFLQEYRFVADQLGVSFEAITGAVGGLTRRIPSIQTGTGRSADAMRTLGVSLYDTEGQMRSMDDLLPSIITALQRMENETERNALANSILGRRAEALIPLLDAEASSVDELRQRFRDMGVAMDDSVIKKGAEFDAKMKEMSMRTEGLRNEAGMLAIEFGENLIPALELFVEMGRKVVGSRFFRELLASWGDQVRNLTDFVRALTGSQDDLGESTGRTAEEIQQQIDNYKEGIESGQLFGESAAYARARIRSLQEELEQVTGTTKEYTEEAKKSNEVQKETAKTVGDLAREIDLLEESIKGMSDSGSIAEAQREIERLQFYIDGLLNRLRPEGEGHTVFDGLVETMDEVSDQINSVDTGLDPDAIFPPGLLHTLQERMKVLRAQLLHATDPEVVERLKTQISELNEEIQAFGPDAEKSTRKADMAMGSLGNSIGGVVGNLIAGRKEALSFGRILASIVPALINVATGGAGGFASSLASGMFGGLFHGGGVVGGTGERMIQVQAGEGVFTKSQMKAMGMMGSSSPQINPRHLQSAFSAALKEHTRKLGPEEVFVMAQKGGRSF